MRQTTDWKVQPDILDKLTSGEMNMDNHADAVACWNAHEKQLVDLVLERRLITQADALTAARSAADSGKVDETWLLLIVAECMRLRAEENAIRYAARTPVVIRRLLWAIAILLAVLTWHFIG
jgi:hypothetical protein